MTFIWEGSPFGKHIGLKLTQDAEGVMRAELALDERYGGPPAYIHGGILTALVDEAMGAAAWAGSEPCVAVHLSIDLRKSVPLHEVFFVIGRFAGLDGKKILTQGEIRLASGELAVEGRGIFVKVPANIKASLEDQYGKEL
ncbi:hypothetical protein MASR2M15_25880 [Anaerolineales bacterium]